VRSIRLRNFRSLRDTGEVQLRPIVLLIGANSSGKSSFLRFFPLLKQTLWQTTSRSPLLWYVDNSDVDFGDFNNALFRNAEDPSIEVSADMSDALGRDVRFSSRIVGGADGRSHVQRFTISSLGDAVTLTISANATIEKLTLNEREIPLPVADARLVVRQSGPIVRVEDSLASHLAHEPLLQSLSDPLRGIVDAETLRGILFDILVDCDHGPAEEVLAELQHAIFSRKSNDSAVIAAKFAESAILERIKTALFLRELGSTLDKADAAVREHARGIRYIAPFRRSPQRFYRRAELQTDEIDRDGSNLAMFLDSLAEPEREAFSTWLRQHFGFGVHIERQDAHVSVMVDIDSPRSFNVMDMGFGMSQLLPVVAQCWLASGQLRSKQLSLFRDPSRSILPGTAPTLIAVEQPELHLHPHHQAQLADMFSSTVHAMEQIGQPLCLCVETHSEAMIYRFGELVEANKFRREDISILLFEKLPGTDESSIRPIEFGADGVLQDWPIGFFRG
jgi:predicted ATPase